MTTWHKGTRFWLFAERILSLEFLLSFAVLIWRPEALKECVWMLTATISVVFGGSSVVKRQEMISGDQDRN